MLIFANSFNTLSVYIFNSLSLMLLLLNKNAVHFLVAYFTSILQLLWIFNLQVAERLQHCNDKNIYYSSLNHENIHFYA